ncbi:hypothetical protein ACLOJK_013142 [Asimina triloba]
MTVTWATELMVAIGYKRKPITGGAGLPPCLSVSPASLPRCPYISGFQKSIHPPPYINIAPSLPPNFIYFRFSTAGKASSKKKEEESSSSAAKDQPPKGSTRRGKRVKAPPIKEEPEFFPEKRNLVRFSRLHYRRMAAENLHCARVLVKCLDFIFFCAASNCMHCLDVPHLGLTLDFCSFHLLSANILEDLWKAAFPVGTENAFDEGGELYGKKVYLFGCTEPQLVFFNNGEGKVICIPVVVAVGSVW